MYVPDQQFSTFGGVLVARTASDPLSFVAAIKEQVWGIDKDRPVYGINTMNRLLAESIATQRFNTLLLASFAALALLLAEIGIYGVMSYSVSQATREIGIRIALGAQRRDVLKLVVGRGLALTLVGAPVGVAGAFGLTRLMANLLFGVMATDPLTFIGVSVLLVVMALLACYLPARRATKVDPMVALRYE
jgi:ABC-type antimicrobial peptide transport system permease subunit